MIDCKNVFNQLVKNDKITYEIIRKIATGQGDDSTTGCLLDYAYIRDDYNMITIDLSKQQVLDTNPRADQQINFIANLDRDGDARIFFLFEEAKETVLDFSQGIVKSCKCVKENFNFYQYKMTQYNSLNVNLSNSQLNKLKSPIKNKTEIVLRLHQID